MQGPHQKPQQVLAAGLAGDLLLQQDRDQLATTPLGEHELSHIGDGIQPFAQQRLHPQVHGLRGGQPVQVRAGKQLQGVLVQVDRA
jgi:hypothetical protein